MSLTLVDHIRKQANLIGYKPRIGIEIPDIQQNFSRSAPFTVIIDSGTDGQTDPLTIDSTLFKSITLDETEVDVGDELTITGGTNDGSYDITSIGVANTVHCSGAVFVTDTGQTWSITRLYLDLLGNSPNFKTYSKQLGGYSPQSGLSLSITNQGLWSNIFATYPNPENSDVNCKLYFDDSTDILASESLLLYTGKIKTFPSIDYQNVGLSIADSTRLKDRIIGSLIEATDAANGATLPTGSIGKMKPIVYGDFRKFADDASASNLSINREQNFSPAVYLGQGTDDTHYWFIAGHYISQIDEIWCWDEDIKRMVRLSSFTLVQNTAAGCIIKHANLEDVYDYWYNDADIVENTINGGTISGSANLGDADKDSFATLTAVDTTNPVGSQNVAELFAFFNPWDHQPVIDAANIVAVDNFCRSSFDEGAYTGNSEFYLESGSGGGTYNLKANVVGTVYNMYDGMADEGLPAAMAITDFPTFVLKGAYNTPGGSSDTNVGSPYLIFKRIKYTPVKILPVFFGGRGREYGTWIDNRDAAEGYTTDHVDNDKSTPGSALIENGAGIIESLLRDELGMGSEAASAASADTDILRNSFNIASSALSTSKMSFFFTKQHLWEQSISPQAESLKSNLYFNYHDRMKIVVFDGVAGFSATGSTVPGNWDIFQDSPIKTFKIVIGTSDRLYFHIWALKIAAGEYTGASLAAEIEIQIATKVGAGNITCKYFASTGTFAFDDVGVIGPYTFKWLTGGSDSIGRFIGFDISADQVMAIASSITSDYGLWADSWVENPIINNSFRMSKQSDDIITDITVNYYKNSQGEFQAEANGQDTTYHSDIISNVYEDLYTKDSATAIIHRDFLLDRLSRRHYVCTIKTFMNAVHVEMWDIINIRHPVLSGIFTEAVMIAKEWVVLSATVDTGTMEISITAIEV